MRTSGFSSYVGAAAMVEGAVMVLGDMGEEVVIILGGMSGIPDLGTTFGTAIHYTD